MSYYFILSKQLNDPYRTTWFEHFVQLKTEEDAKKLVFLIANSEPTQDSTYYFRKINTGDPTFKPGERVGTISTNHFSWWIVGWITETVTSAFQGTKHVTVCDNHIMFRFHLRHSTITKNLYWQCCVWKLITGAPKRYTLRVYRSPEKARKCFTIVYVSYLHSLFLFAESAATM